MEPWMNGRGRGSQYATTEASSKCRDLIKSHRILLMVWSRSQGFSHRWDDEREALFFFCVLQKTLFSHFWGDKSYGFSSLLPVIHEWFHRFEGKTYEKTSLDVWGNPRRLFPAVYRICHLLPWRERRFPPKVFPRWSRTTIIFKGHVFHHGFVFPSLSPVAWLITEFNS